MEERDLKVTTANLEVEVCRLALEYAASSEVLIEATQESKLDLLVKALCVLKMDY